MVLKIALLLSMLIQLGAAITAVSLIRRTRFNISWILISAGFVLMALRRLFEFSSLFWETQLITKVEFSSWIGVMISILMLAGVIFIRQIFNLQDRIELLRKENESRLLKAVIQGEEQARRSIARDLHDGLGPVLSSIKMTVSAIDSDKMDQSNQKMIELTCKATDEAIVALKEISNHLSPHLLKNYGLTKSLETISSQMLANSTIAFNLSGNIEAKRFRYDIEIGLFRVISELLNNSLKHAAPDKISLNITETGDLLKMTYSDNGVGFEMNNQPNSLKGKGMGFENIRSRIKSMNGVYYLDSEPGKGMNMTIQIPLK
ncbi:ATP-binding protein [Maribellus sp. YY47]|uniref:sensor histidine kinase n=1 Tax=Maribellus sp. YY47 TaxID=2929486 RepID=UPI00200183D4|nr:ATP-binding protein [Maribellus sp. YY47]MCK3683135.1 ATP-binding protein [Maribellus sp. YY47]